MAALVDFRRKKLTGIGNIIFRKAVSKLILKYLKNYDIKFKTISGPS
jgi:hypothetical protein